MIVKKEGEPTLDPGLEAQKEWDKGCQAILGNWGLPNFLALWKNPGPGRLSGAGD